MCKVTGVTRPTGQITFELLKESALWDEQLAMALLLWETLVLHQLFYLLCFFEGRLVGSKLHVIARLFNFLLKYLF